MKIYYYGADGYLNYGDDAVKQMIMSMGFEHDENSDILMIGAGTMLPITPHQGRFKEFNKKKFKDIIVLGAGVNDPCDETFLKLTKEYLKNSDFIGLRDTGSKDLLGFGQVVGDPLFLLSVNNIKKKPYALINIGFNYGDVLGGFNSQFEYLIAVAKFVKEFIIGKLGLKVIIMPLEKCDEIFTDALIRHVGIDNIYDELPISVLQGMSEAQFVLAYKQHGMITALAVGTPVIALAYNKKAINVAKEFGLENHIIPINELTYDKLVESYNRLNTIDYVKIEIKKQELSNKMRIFVMRFLEKYGEFNGNSDMGR